MSFIVIVLIFLTFAKLLAFSHTTNRVFELKFLFVFLIFFDDGFFLFFRFQFFFFRAFCFFCVSSDDASIEILNV